MARGNFPACYYVVGPATISQVPFADFDSCDHSVDRYTVGLKLIGDEQYLTRFFLAAFSVAPSDLAIRFSNR
jgi:hypothetical protein